MSSRLDRKIPVSSPEAPIPVSPKQFDVWWISLPDPVGRRPVLLLGRTSSLGLLSRILVVEVTTKVRGIPQEIAMGKREGLPRRCVANLDSLRTILPQHLDARIGALASVRQVEVKRALGHVLQWPELTGL